MTEPGTDRPSRRSHLRTVLSSELDHVRHGDLDLNPADLTRFSFPLLLRLAGVLAFGAVPLAIAALLSLSLVSAAFCALGARLARRGKVRP